MTARWRDVERKDAIWFDPEMNPDLVFYKSINPCGEIPLSSNPSSEDGACIVVRIERTNVPRWDDQPHWVSVYVEVRTANGQLKSFNALNDEPVKGKVNKWQAR